MSADTTPDGITTPAANADAEGTILSQDQIRGMLRLYGERPKWSIHGSSLKDIAEALDIPLGEAEGLLRRFNAEPRPVVTVPKIALLQNHIALVLSFIGLFIAGTLSLSHVLERSVPCGDNGGCDTVTSNSASMILGIPVAYLGFGAYVLLAAISATRAFRGLGRTNSLGMVALGISGVGALFSFYLQYVSFMQIHAVCYWCLSSALTMCFLFLVQAALAQTEIPRGAQRVGDGSIAFTVGLVLLTGLGLGYETLHLNQRPAMLPSGLPPGVAQQLITPDSLKLGPDSAPIKLVEFSDLVCPSCKAFYPQVMTLVNGSNGKIQLIFRNRPLTHNPEHKMALPAAFFGAYAADRGLGWQFVDEMYQHDNPDLQTLDSIYAVAKKVGLNVDDAKAHMKDNDPDTLRVDQDLALAQNLGIDITPTFVLLTKGYPQQILEGSQLFDAIKQPPYSEILNGK